MTYGKKLDLFTAAIAVGLLTFACTSAQAQTGDDMESVLLAPSLATPVAQVQPTPSGPEVIEGEPIPPAATPAPTIVEEPLAHAHIAKYKTDKGARRMLACNPVIETVLAVDDPCDGSKCFYAIPVCLPECCVGEPKVYARGGIFGRGIVEFCWDCGFKVKVVFRHVIGGVVVHYEA